MDWDQVISGMTINRDKLCDLKDKCGKSEKKLSRNLFVQLGWNNYKNSFEGLFGWQRFDSDHKVKLDRDSFVVEVKKVTEGSEYGYWHAVIQGLLYQFRLSGSCPVLCIILDWGRRSGQKLTGDDKAFLSQFQKNSIYFIRFNLSNDFFIEHNLKGNWNEI